MKNSYSDHPIIRVYSKMGAPETVFFVSLISLFFIPFIMDIQNHLLNSILISFFIFSLYYLIHSSSPKRKKLFIAPLLIAFIITWLKHFDIVSPVVVGYFFEVIIMVISFLFVFRSIFKAPRVSINTLMAAISGYLLIGIGFGLIVMVFELVNVNSFSFKGDVTIHSSYYYSFVTMSTLGYGDIVPLTTKAKGLSILITLIGQFYMAIVVGLLIGKLIANPQATQE